jgi:hypothetical protein
VFTIAPKRADPVPGPRPAPELARYDQIHTERTREPAPGTLPARPGEALGVLAAVLDRDGQQRSATQARQQALADADHLALLHAIWTAETTPARQHRYRDLLMAALPPEHHNAPGHQARWLYRTLRTAELAGLEPAQVLADAIGERDLAGSRDPAAVLDARIRSRLGAPVPHPAGPWSAHVPAIADPGAFMISSSWTVTAARATKIVHGDGLAMSAFRQIRVLASRWAARVTRHRTSSPAQRDSSCPGDRVADQTGGSARVLCGSVHHLAYCHSVDATPGTVRTGLAAVWPGRGPATRSGSGRRR